MFNKFQEEFDEVYRFRVDVVEVHGDDKKFKVQSMAGRHEEFIVKFNITSKVGGCGCQLYDFMGLPCKHLLTIFQHLFLDEIPSNFIMKRWTKDANKVEVLSSEGFPMHDRHLGADAVRISQMCRLSTQLAYL
ncbi:zinc finger protein [Macleaya cordata]|uniref:Protein FAR1-RELATED SEQUENCE n=1 Tax=Macleaya cordata TaxID=56857 RepID=A0A200RCD7_MACCD|nr:zinc finger protein [Macleaya cordata]